MKSLVKLQLLALTMLISISSVAYGQITATVAPTTLPVGAYVNGADGDHYFMQALTFTPDGTIGATTEWAVALPSGVTIADIDDDLVYLDEIYISHSVNAGAAAVLTISAATASSFTIDITTLNGMLTGANTILQVIFPVETDTAEATSLTYTVTATNGGASTAGTSNAVALDDTVTLATFDGTYLKDDEIGKVTTNNLGRRHPDNNSAPAALAYTAALPDLIAELAAGAAQAVVAAADNWLPGNALLDNSDDDGEVNYRLWASTTSDLKRINNGVGEMVTDFSTNNPLATAFEAATIVSAATQTTGAMDISGMAEGNWFFYITADATGEWVLAESDTLAVRHWPTFVDATNTGAATATIVATGGGLGRGDGIDYDHDGLFEPVAAVGNQQSAGDDATVTTLESGATIGRDGTLIDLTGTPDNNPVFNDVDVYWTITDIDDNARIHVFYSTASNLADVDSVTVTAGVVSALGANSTEITSSAIYEEDINNYINWDTYTDATTYVAAADYFLYVVAYDGTNLAVNKVGNEAGASLTVTVAHFPYFKFHDITSIADAGNFDTAVDQYMAISWGEDIDDDLDPDANGTAVINLYYVPEAAPGLYANVVAGSDPTASASLTNLTTLGTLIASIVDSSDTKEANSYMWDLRSAALTPAVYSLWASITHGSNTLVVQYNSDTNPVTPAAVDDKSFTVVNAPHILPLNPVEGALVELSNTDRFELRWDAFDVDATTANKDVIIFMAPVNTVTSTISVLDAANTATYYALTSTTGEDFDALVNGNTENLIIDVTSITTALDATVADPSGDYYVYYYFISDGTGIADNTYAPTLADGQLRFTAALDPVTSFELSPNQGVYEKGDTITVTIYANEGGTNNPEFLNIYLDVPSANFDVLDQVSGTAGTQPILNEAVNFVGAIQENSLTTTGGVHSINYIEWATGGDALATLLAVGSMQLVVTQQTTVNGFDDQSITFSTSGSRTTGMIDLNGQPIPTTVPAEGANFRLARPGIISGFVDLEARADLGEIVTIKVVPEGSFTPLTDSEFITANDDATADGTDGMQVTLTSGGGYSLSKVPAGEYDLIVTADGYLAQVVENVVVQSLSTTSQDLTGGNKLLAGDVSGYDHDGSSATFEQGDNKIDTDDTGAITTAWNATSDSTSTWNGGLFDLDKDGTVYISDLNLAATNTGSGEGAVYNKTIERPNDDAVTYMEMIASSGNDYTYSVRARNLASLHAYAIELSYNKANWELVSHEDGLAAEAGTAHLAHNSESGASIASAILGHGSGYSSEQELATFTLRSRNGSRSSDPALSQVSLIDASGTLSQSVIGSPDAAMPTEFGLSQNYPNPFNPTTNISFALPEPGNVKLAVFNLLGQEVRSLTSGNMEPGNYKMVWNAVDNSGAKVSSGIYFYRLVVNNKIVDTKKMLLLK